MALPRLCIISANTRPRSVTARDAPAKPNGVDAGLPHGATGGAIILCSATTPLGYGALLVSDNPAIRSRGLPCVLGELACVSAATLVLLDGPAERAALARRQTGARRRAWR